MDNQYEVRSPSTILDGGLTGELMVYIGEIKNKLELFAVTLDPTSYTIISKPFQISNTGEYGEPFWPSISKDKKTICYGLNEYNRDIHIKELNVDSACIIGSLIPVSVDRRFDKDPYWAPDGRSIIFISNRDGHDELYSYNISSGKSDQLTFTESVKKYPQFSPDGKMISFFSEDSIWYLPSEGGKPKILLSNNIKIASRYLWMDNKKLILDIMEGPLKRTSKLIEYDLVAKTYKDILNDLFRPDFALSPNGKFLAVSGLYVEKDNASYYENIAILNIENDSLTILSRMPARYPKSRLLWTNDNKSIICENTSLNNDLTYELIPINGEQIRKIQITGDLIGDRIFLEHIDPTGKFILITTETRESDIWILSL